MLGRRYYLIQRAKESLTVGILIGTLAAGNILDTIIDILCINILSV